MHSFLLASPVLFLPFFLTPTLVPAFPVAPHRSSSTLSGWLHVAWAQRARLWLTAVSRAKLRAFAPFWLCKRAIPVPMATQLPVMKVSILTVWCHLAIIRSTRPNRYRRGETHFSIDILLGCRKCLWDESHIEAELCCSTKQKKKKNLITWDMFCNVPAPPADPSNPGCVPERGSALTNGRTDAIPADLASPA